MKKPNLKWEVLFTWIGIVMFSCGLWTWFVYVAFIK